VTDTNYGTFVPIKNEINYAITFAKPPEWSISFKPNGTIEMSDSLRDQPEEAARKFLEHLQNQFARIVGAARIEGVKMGLEAAAKAADESIDALSDDCCLDHVGDAVAAIRNLDAEAIVKETK